MSTVSADLLTQKLQQDLRDELITTNQLLQLISHELQQIRQMTSPGGELETDVATNAALAKTLADLQQLDLDKLPPLPRMQVDLNHPSNQNVLYDEHGTFRNNSTVNESH